jgi:integrase
MKQKRQFPKASPYIDCRGKRRWRYYEKGLRVELGTAYGSDEFIRRYEAAEAGAKVKRRIGADRVRHGTVNDLVARFYEIAFAGDRLTDSTKLAYRGILERFRQEHGDKQVAGLKAVHVEKLIAEKADTPSAANNFRKRLAQVLDLAVKLEWLTTNPARQTKPLDVESGGHHTWSEDDIARFYEVHKPGTLPHRAMTLMLWTGAARVDAVKLGWFSIKQTPEGERLQYRRQKTKRSGGELVSIPLHPELRAVLDICPKGPGTFLQTQYGKQRSAKSLTGDMRKWCDKAGLPECTPHGLRKAIARRLAEAGATAAQIMAWTGHKTLSEVQRYIAAANREGMADMGLDRLLERPNPERNVVNMPSKFAKSSSNPLQDKD